MFFPLEGKSFGKKDDKDGLQGKVNREEGAWVKNPGTGKSSVGAVHVNRLRLLP